MAKILITHPIDPISIEKLSLKKIHPSLKPKTAICAIAEEVFYVKNLAEEIFYIPSIAIKQTPEEARDPSLESLRQILETIQPDVLIVGNNAVPKKAIASWREAVGKTKKLLVIRRGVDTRAIDKQAAIAAAVTVSNLPGINSPFVADHMIKCLELDKAKTGSKIAIIGVGNIGKKIALKAIERNMSVHLLSPSLQDNLTRDRYLTDKEIPANKVVCADSIIQATNGASYLAIAIPWENKSGSTNQDIVTVEHIKSLKANAKIASASVPRIFAESALKLTNDLAASAKIYIRIDTSKRRARETLACYPYLDICHDRAFASSECQQELDNAMLQQARQFIVKNLFELVK